MLFMQSVLVAQNQSPSLTQVDPDRYANFDFKGKFASRLDIDQIPFCFIVDFDKLEGNFEMVYFMEKSFSVQEIVNLGYQPGQKRVLFKSFSQYPESLILQKFDELFKMVKADSEKWNMQEKENWLLKHDKYSKPVQK